MTNVYTVSNGRIAMVTNCKRLAGSIEKARNKYPDRVAIIGSSNGCIVYSVPETWIRIVSPQALSEAERNRRREHAKELRRLKKDKKSKDGTMT